MGHFQTHDQSPVTVVTYLHVHLLTYSVRQGWNSFLNARVRVRAVATFSLHFLRVVLYLRDFNCFFMSSENIHAVPPGAHP